MIKIPLQLQSENIRFVILEKKGKRPIEKDWVNNTYNYEDENLQNAISNGHNYGVACGKGLIVIDCDKIDMYNIVNNIFSDTFIVKTRKGYHFYLFCENFDKKRILEINGEHMGEIQSFGTQVVGPNSIHPEGDVYIPINNNNIKRINKDNIDEKLKIYYKGIEKKQNSINTDNRKNGAREGSRNNFIFTEACIVRKSNYSYEQALAHCLTFNEKNNPPLSDDEVISCVKSAYKYDDNLLDQVTMYMANNNYSMASEIVVKNFLKNNRTYTFRNDKVVEMWIYKDGIYLPDGQSYIVEECRNIIEEKHSTRMFNLVLNKIIADTYVDQKKFFEIKNIELIAVENGILNLRTRELSDFNPDIIFFNKLPMKYNKDAKCPNVIKHFKDVLKSENDIPVLQELFGYILWKDNFMEKAFMFSGSGRNGKGKTLTLIQNFVGLDNCTSLSLKDIEDGTFIISDMHNKMVNLAGDISSESLAKVDKFKGLVGRDMIRAQRKFLSPVSFINYAKMIFVANELPKVYDNTDGWWTKWLLLEFPYTFKTQAEINEIKEEERKMYKLIDVDHMKKLSNPEEMEGMLNWALDGLDRILDKKEFSYSKSTTEIKDFWMRKNDSFAAFINQFIEQEYGCKIVKMNLRCLYIRYCEKNRITQCGDRHIKKTLETKFGITETMVDSKHCWIGIKYKNSNKVMTENKLHEFSVIDEKDFEKLI